MSERASFSLLCPLYSFFSSVSSFFLLSLLASLFSLFASLLSLLSLLSSSFNLLFFFLGAYIASISKRHIRRSMVSHNCYTSSFLSFALSRLSSRFTLISCLCSFLCSLVALVAAFVSLLCLRFHTFALLSSCLSLLSPLFESVIFVSHSTQGRGGRTRGPINGDGTGREIRWMFLLSMI